MCLYDGPRDVTEHVAEIRERFGNFGYDHSKSVPSSLREEMQAARMRGRTVSGSETVPGTHLLAKVMARLRAFRRSPLQAN